AATMANAIAISRQPQPVDIESSCAILLPSGYLPTDRLIAQPLSVYPKSSLRSPPQSSTGPGRISDRRRLNEAAGESGAVLWGFNPWQGLRATPFRPPHHPRQPPWGFPKTVQRRDLPHTQAPQPRFRYDDYTARADGSTTPGLHGLGEKHWH